MKHFFASSSIGSAVTTTKTTTLLFKRLQSTTTLPNTTNNATKPPGLSIRLANLIENNLKENKSSSEIFNNLNTEVDANMRPGYKIYKSAPLTQALKNLLKKSENDSKIENIQNSSILPPSPYEILTKLINLDIASPVHFELVMADLLKNHHSYKDVLSLWVLFIQNFDATSGSSRTLSGGKRSSFTLNNIRSYVAIAYLGTCIENNSSTPSYEILSKILQVSENNGSSDIPFALIHRFIVNDAVIVNDPNLVEQFTSLFQELYNSYIESHIVNKNTGKFDASFLSNSNRVSDLRQIIELYNDKTNKYPQIYQSLMVALTDLNYAPEAIKLYNNHKDSKDCKRALLYAVSELNAPNKVKYDRLQALWNTLFVLPTTKDSGNVLEAEDYKWMLKSLYKCKNFKNFNNFWFNDVPKDFKDKYISLQAVYYECTPLYSDPKVLTNAVSFLKKNFNKNTEQDLTSLLVKVLNELLVAKDFINYDSLIAISNPILLNKNYDFLASKLHSYLVRDQKSGSKIEIEDLLLKFPLEENFYKVVESLTKVTQDPKVIEKLVSIIMSHKLELKSQYQEIIATIIKFYFRNNSFEKSEDIFKESFQQILAHDKSTRRVVEDIRLLVDSMISGFTEKLISTKDNSFFNKLNVYFEVFNASAIKLNEISRVPLMETILSNRAMNRLIHAIALSNGKLTESESQIVDKFLLYYEKHKKFYRINVKDSIKLNLN
ncbi:Msc6p SCDLUD_003362 [Saccharomycodes ludwigii]|uniref:Msc6p n=1 Tax=Saccharomycodes ludwigii TaxID=36035 RepID=UPI001E83F4AC|nr:hypothetical protein SCDLUD_003362 [Saccharomycodes ludwigii]KAH3900385.1 hypothetical protein SCDLUD_003362 [Saccharomycodes ludwigii]